MRFDALVEHVGDARVLEVDDESTEAYGALAGGLATLLGDVLDVGWFSIRHWAGVTLVVEFAGQVQEHPLPSDGFLDLRAVVLPFARAARGSSARLLVVRTGEGTAVVRFDDASAIELAMDLPVRCPACKAAFDARRLWSEEEARCVSCGADLAVPDVLAAFVDEVMPEAAAAPAEAAAPPGVGLTAEMRRKLVELRRPSVDALVAAVGTINPEELLDDEHTDPSIYLDDLPPHKDEPG